MSIVAMSSISILNVDDGNGVVSVEVKYAIGSSPTDPPGQPLMDGTTVIVDVNNIPLTDADWQSTIPIVPQGSYLWTRTVTTYANGDFSIVYVVGYTGEDGTQGSQGLSIASEKEQWYLSDSNVQLTGGSWSYTEPSTIPEGKYLFGRWEFTMSDSSVQYSDAVYRSSISGVINITDDINKKINQRIWQSDIDSKISTYDTNTAQSMRDRISETEQSISGITSTVSDVQSTLATKADGSTVTDLASTVSQNKQAADSFQQTVTSTYAKLTDVATQIGSIKIGGNNLYIIRDEVPGYLNSGNSGSISAQSSTKEYTSDYIPVKAGNNYIIQAWATPASAGRSWLAYEFFSDDDPVTVIGQRVAKYGADSGSGVETTAEGQERLTYDVTAPTGATLLRVSYRKWDDGYCMVENATKPSEYAINPIDLEQYTDSAVQTAKTEIKQTTDAIELSVSSKVGNNEVISKINQSSESITIDASKVNLVGNVTFSMLDTSTQNTINGAASTATTANEKANIGLGMKVNYSSFSTADSGECYLHGYTNGVAADVDGYVYWNEKKITVPKKMLNPNVILPYWTTIYVVLRLSSATATTGTLYMVWYNSGWKYAVTPTPTAVGGTWTWAETTDIVLGQFIETGSEAQVVNAYLYNPPRNASHIQTTGSNSYQYAKTGVDWVSSNGSAVLTAKNIVNNWATDASSATTTIKGGLIQTHTILSEQLATNAIMSSNYNSGVADSDIPSTPYSITGSFLDLSTGNLYMPNFGVNGTTGEAYFNGTVNANAGHFGGDTSYWNIETVYDYNNTAHAALVGTGSPYLQTGNWQVSDNAVATRKYTSTATTTGTASYYKDTATNTYYDVGMKIPTNFAAYSANDSSTVRYNKSFYYGRKYTGNTVPSMDSDWTYFFMVDTDGNIYENGVKLSSKYASIDGVSGAYLPLTGGVVTGNLTVQGTLTATASSALKLANPRNIQTNLSSTSAVAFDGSANITPGVTGTLGVGNGGTGATTFTSGQVLIGNGGNAIGTRAIRNNTSVNALGWTSASTDTTLVTTNTIAYWDGRYQTTNNNSNLEYVKLGKLGTVVTHNYAEFITTNGGEIDGALSVTELTSGDLVVTGAARFTNTIYGNISGSASSATTAGSVDNNLKIQFDSGTTEGTNQFTYNGSAVKNINITKSSIGLGNVENTKLSTWAGSSNLTTTKVGTLAGAAVKAVDTSISASSSSANLPTSAAVASFVEGKGYVTSSGVTSVTLKAGTGISLDTDNTAITTTGTRTISLANTYGDTKNPYGTKTANYVLAGPSSGSAAAPSFRALVAADIPSITKSKISDFPTTWALSSVTGADDLKAIEALTGTSGMLKKTAANTWALTTVVSGLAITGTNNDVLTVTKSDGTTQDLTINITGQVVTGATVLSDAQGNTISLGSTSAPVYFSNGVPVQANTIPTIALNGSNTTSASLYAPSGAGTSGQVLKSSGSGAPTWVNQSTLSVGSATSATTATKFSSARSIALTGDVTGSASSDGTSGWSIATTVGDNSHNHDSTTIVPIATKTYTGLLGSSSNNAANDSWYYMGVRPTDYYSQWKFRFKVIATVPNHNEFRATSDITLYGYGQSAAPAYSIFNTHYSASYRPYYFHNFYRLTQAGYNTNLYNAIGLGLRASNERNTSGYERTVTIEILETVNCSYNFIDTPVKWASWTNGTSANYAGLTEYNGCDNGLQETGDANSNTYDRRYLGTTQLTAGTNGIKKYSVIMQDTEGKWQSLTTTTGNDVTHTKNTAGFRFGTIYRFIGSTDIASGALCTNNYVYETGDMDFRYASNCAQTLTARKSVYLVGTVTNGYFYLDDTWHTQDLPTTDDGKVYIYFGEAQSTFQVTYAGYHPVYWYKNGAVRQFGGDAQTVTGHTVAKDVPSDAVFTDTTALTSMTGILPVGKGGTGQTTGQNAANYFLNELSTGSSTPVDADYYISQYVNGGTTTTTYHRRPMSALWNYIKSKADPVYANITGDTFTGAVSGTSFAASGYLAANSGNSGTAGGIALYSTTPTQYGIAMRNISNGGTHGYVNNDWATYFCMAGTSAANSLTRGWIFKNATNGNVTSISGAGNIVTNGSVTIGGNTTNDSGMRMEYDATLACTNFIFY